MTVTGCADRMQGKQRGATSKQKEDAARSSLALSYVYFQCTLCLARAAGGEQGPAIPVPEMSGCKPIDFFIFLFLFLFLSPSLGLRCLAAGIVDA